MVDPTTAKGKPQVPEEVMKWAQWKVEEAERHGYLVPAEVKFILSLAADNAATEPAGEWVRVPREPTEAMIEAGMCCQDRHDGHYGISRERGARITWNRMLAVAPAATNGAAQGNASPSGVESTEPAPALPPPPQEKK